MTTCERIAEETTQGGINKTQNRISKNHLGFCVFSFQSHCKAGNNYLKNKNLSVTGTGLNDVIDLDPK